MIYRPALALTLFLFACGGKSPGTDAGPPLDSGTANDAGNSVADAGTPVITQAIIGVDGGVLRTDSGVQLAFDYGSVDSNTQITLTETGQAPAGALSQRYVLEPDGLVFAHPVGLQIPLPAGVTNAALYWKHPGDAGTYDQVGGTVDGGILSAKVVHFSDGYLGAVASSRTVTGSLVVTYQSQGRSNIINQPEDFSQLPVSALVWQDGGYVSYPGSGLSDGTFSIPNVPNGEYLLQAGTGGAGGNLYFVTSKDAIDMGFANYGRPDALPAANPSYITLDVSNMSPWQSGEWLEMLASDVNMGFFQVDQLDISGVAPDAGDTSVSLTFNAGSPGLNATPTLIQGSHNPPDTVAVGQLVSAVTDAGLPYIAMQRIASLPPFDEVSDGGVTVSANLVDLSSSASASFDIRATRFAQYLFAPDGGLLVAPPSAVIDPTWPAIDVQGVGGGLANGVIGFTADLALASLPTQGPDVVTGGMDYGVPPGQNWGVFASYEYLYGATYQLPCTVNATNCPTGISNPGYVAGVDFGVRDTVGGLSAAPVVPKLSPVQSPMVNGASLYADSSGLGLTPTFSWTAPAVGTPDYYQLFIEHLYLRLNPRGRYVTGVQQVALIDTPHTSFTLPPGILQAGEAYVVVIGAFNTGFPNAAQAPRRRGLPLALASVQSGTLRP